MPIIFLRIAWMKEYRGITKEDRPIGGGTDESKGEVNNFNPIKGTYYGYVWVKGNGNLNLENLGVFGTQPFIEGVTVIFFATNPETGGQYIVGWYRNAKLFREGKRKPNGWGYRATASIGNVTPLEERQRTFPIPKNGPGTSHIWYGKNVSKNYITKVLKYIDNPGSYKVNSRKKRSSTQWQKDAEIKKQVEVEAMNVVESFYLSRGYTVDYLHKQNLGWDLQAKLGRQILFLEVKGLSGEFVSVELTPNEFKMSKRYKKNYKICIVSHALVKNKQKLDIYYEKDNEWMNNDNQVLTVKPILSGRFCSTANRVY